MSGTGNSSRKRSWSRRLAMQALYQLQLARQNLITIEAQFLEETEIQRADLDYFRELLHGVPRQMTLLEQSLAPSLERPLEQVDPVERAILWIATYEFIERPDIPYRVVINEAVELAKRFGADQSHRFVNGVLDKTAHRIRQTEIASR